VEVVVVGEAGEVIEDVAGAVQQPVFEDRGVAEEFPQVFGLVFGEGDRFGGHGVVSVSVQAGMAARRGAARRGPVRGVVRGRV
jgi:hypothetical protein